jgi:hypothetical protein
MPPILAVIDGLDIPLTMWLAGHNPLDGGIVS